MEVLEIAQVEMYCAGEVVMSTARRKEVLCVFWEGTCVERRVHSMCSDVSIFSDGPHGLPGAAIWHAGDWTGPLSLQPDILHSSDSMKGEKPEDIVAVSNEGVKVSMFRRPKKILYDVMQIDLQSLAFWLTGNRFDDERSTHDTEKWFETVS